MYRYCRSCSSGICLLLLFLLNLNVTHILVCISACVCMRLFSVLQGGFLCLKFVAKNKLVVVCCFFFVCVCLLATREKPLVSLYCWLALLLLLLFFLSIFKFFILNVAHKNKTACLPTNKILQIYCRFLLQLI